jgi:hypothetical protein
MLDQHGIMRILLWESLMWECLHKTSPSSVMGLPLSRYVLCCCNAIIQDSEYRYISNSYFFFKKFFSFSSWVVVQAMLSKFRSFNPQVAS